MILDVLIRQGPSMKYNTVGRSFYVPHGAHPLPNGAEIWQGYYQSARPTVGKFHIFCLLWSIVDQTYRS